MLNAVTVFYEDPHFPANLNGYNPRLPRVLSCYHLEAEEFIKIVLRVADFSADPISKALEVLTSKNILSDVTETWERFYPESIYPDRHVFVRIGGFYWDRKAKEDNGVYLWTEKGWIPWPQALTNGTMSKWCPLRRTLDLRLP